MPRVQRGAMQRVLFWVLVLLACSIHKNGSYLLLQWCVGLGLGALFIGYRIFQFVGLLPALAFTYTLLNGIYMFGYEFNMYATTSVPAHAQMSLRFNALYSTLSVLCVGLIVTLLTSKERRAILHAVPIFTLANSLYVIIGAVFGFGMLPNGTGYSGLINYAGLNGCLIAIGIPSFFRYLRGWRVFSSACIGVCFLAVVLSKSSIPYGVLVVSVTAYYAHRKRRTLDINELGVWICGTLLVGVFVERRGLFDSAGRFQAYKVFMSDWLDRGHYLFGNGLGSFIAMSRNIQAKHSFMVNEKGQGFFWSTLHSDWLQTLFELGLVGLVLYSVLFISCARRLWAVRSEYSSRLLALLMGVAACAVFDYPARYFVLSTLLAFVAVGAYRMNEERREEPS